MEIIYTLHAEEQVKERKIELVWIEEAINSPDQTKRVGNKFYVVKKLNGKRIKVVFVKERFIKVITSYFIN